MCAVSNVKTNLALPSLSMLGYDLVYTEGSDMFAQIQVYYATLKERSKGYLVRTGWQALPVKHWATWNLWPMTAKSQGMARELGASTPTCSGKTQSLVPLSCLFELLDPSTVTVGSACTKKDLPYSWSTGPILLHWLHTLFSVHIKYLKEQGS